MKKQLTDRRRHYLEDVGARRRELVEKKCEILDTKYTAEEKTNKMDKLQSWTKVPQLGQNYLYKGLLS